MFRLRQNLGEDYSPLYFLAALGAGGLAISFFMYLMFMTPHPTTPIPTWDSVTAVFTHSSLALQVLAGIALFGIAALSILHIRLLVWNIAEYRQFKQTSAYETLRTGNAEVQLMAIPLTLAMSVNVSFILGALFVPGLWNVVEYLFPVAIVAFAAIGIYGIRTFVDFFSRILVHGQFDCSRNNNLSQMLAIFAFAMIGVGFSAPAAMSTNTLTSGIGMILSLLFLSGSGVLAFTKMVLGFRSMLEHGIDKEGSASLWIIIPIITVSGIALYRLGMAMHHNFSMHIERIQMLVFFSILISIQIMFAVIGYSVMKKLGYFSTYISGEGKSKSSFSLICPGVAAFVLAFFFIHIGLVGNGLLEKNSVAYWVFLLPLVALQFKTLATLFQLNKKLLARIS
ncbi:MAG: hypothetical protein CR991_01440 [Proteobacteria bacterium]|nr:MAG: hypothetical protein CR991_01440 [Pseudomonadota bacterium]